MTAWKTQSLFWIRTHEDGSIPTYVRSDQIEAIAKDYVVTDGGRKYAIDDQQKFIKRLTEADQS